VRSVSTDLKHENKFSNASDAGPNGLRS